MPGHVCDMTSNPAAGPFLVRLRQNEKGVKSMWFIMPQTCSETMDQSFDAACSAKDTRVMDL